jgi:hypothetical protein
MRVPGSLCDDQPDEKDESRLGTSPGRDDLKVTRGNEINADVYGHV